MSTTILTSAWDAIILNFSPVFTQPTAQIFINLITGWILCTARRTVTGILPFAEPKGKRPHDAYHRLFPKSRRRGNAIRQHLASAGIIEAVNIATRSGQVVLYQLTDLGRDVCSAIGIALSAKSRESLEHRYWVSKVAKFFESKGYEVKKEHLIKGNGAIDLLAERGGESVAIEIETGKSDIKTNLKNIIKADFDRAIVLATSPEAVTACQKAIDSIGKKRASKVELLTWLDIS